MEISDPALKLIHVSCAYVTGAGFLLRGILALTEHPIAAHRLTKTLPHIIDSLLLLSAIGMLVQWSISIPVSPWLQAKIAALLLYIAFGMTMLRWGKTKRIRLAGLIGGMVTYSYIIGVAHIKSVLVW